MSDQESEHVDTAMNPKVNATGAQIVVCNDRESAAKHAADLFANLIRQNPSSVLGLATGGTPIPMYQQLIRLHKAGELDFSQVTTFNLDEYLGLAPEHEQSYRAFMQRELFDHINVAPNRTHIPDGLASDPESHAAGYESLIQQVGGIDVQLLGIGHNGHIAFNEPGSPANSRTRVIGLTERTIQSNSRFFESIDDVPKRAITMGIETIMESKQIILVATGHDKADAIDLAVNGPCSENHPASLLQNHPRVTIVLDQAAAGNLADE